MTICEENQCTGCAACLNACYKGAIRMMKGINGHLYPSIDIASCVECKACQKACPNNTSPTYYTPSKSYIATAKNIVESQTSTSAGIASVLTRIFIQTGGVVYGCCGCDITNVHHIRICDEMTLDQLKGSKYVQSAIADSFSRIKTDLSSGLKVLFIGTPCQVAGLYGYLRKPFENLFTVDLVCHGVPSQQILCDALQEYLPGSNFEKYSVSFRHKSKGKSQYGLFVKDEKSELVLNSTFPKNEFITGFLNGLFYRESCYQCHYSRPNRVSDITLGDYWDHENVVTIENKQHGMSMVIVNTEKGTSLISKISSHVNLLVGDYSDFIKRNGQLHHPIKKSEGYSLFAELYPQKGFIPAARISLKSDFKRIRRNQILNSIAYTVYSIPGVKKIVKLFRNNE